MGKRKGGKGSEEPVIAGRSIDFLGYVFSRENVRLRKTVKHNFAVKVKRTKSETRLKQVKASYWGWCKWGHCRHLWRTITNNDMSFAEKGIKANKKTKDGKKYFSVKSVSISDVLNVPVTIVDFETGIYTSKGDDRYAVLFIKDGEQCKFVTSAFEIKNVLDQAREAEKNGQKIFPVENVIIRKRSFGDGKSSYYFDE
jgi:hypothetical protein